MASWYALAAIVDLVAMLAWVVVQTDSDELVCWPGRSAGMGLHCATRSNPQYRHVHPEHPAIGNSSQERNLLSTPVEEIIEAPPTMQQQHGLCNNAYCSVCRGPRHCVCTDGDEGHPCLVMIVRSSVMQPSGIQRTLPRTSTNQEVVRWLCLSDSRALAKHYAPALKQPLALLHVR